MYIGDKMTLMWPIWWCISEEAQEALKKYQKRVYHYNLQTPPEPPNSHIDIKLESSEEIDRIKKLGWRYGKLPRHLRDKDNG